MEDIKMEEIEKYIVENREKFNEGEMPQGHKERFLKKLSSESANVKTTFVNNEKRRNVKFFLKISIPIAATLVICLTVFLFHNSKPTIEVVPQIAEMKEMELLEQEIDQLSMKNDTITRIQTRNAVNSITFEAIPMTQQLPKIISPKERAKILKNYYKQKVEGLKKVKTFLAERNNANEEDNN